MGRQPRCARLPWRFLLIGAAIWSTLVKEGASATCRQGPLASSNFCALPVGLGNFQGEHALPYFPIALCPILPTSSAPYPGCSHSLLSPPVSARSVPLRKQRGAGQAREQERAAADHQVVRPRQGRRRWPQVRPPPKTHMHTCMPMCTGPGLAGIVAGMPAGTPVGYSFHANTGARSEA